MRGQNCSDTLSSSVIRKYEENAYDWCPVFDSVESYDINVLVLTTGIRRRELDSVTTDTWSSSVSCLSRWYGETTDTASYSSLSRPRDMSLLDICVKLITWSSTVSRKCYCSRIAAAQTCFSTVSCPDDSEDRAHDRWLILFSVVSYELNVTELLNEVCRRRLIFVSTSDADTDWLLIKLDEMTEQSDDCVLDFCRIQRRSVEC